MDFTTLVKANQLQVSLKKDVSFIDLAQNNLLSIRTKNKTESQTHESNVVKIDKFLNKNDILEDFKENKEIDLYLQTDKQLDNVKPDGKLLWNITRVKTNIPTGYIYIPDHVKTIKGVRLNPFTVQNDSNIYHTNDYLNRWTLLIDEFSAQSFIVQSTNYHFMFGAENVDSGIMKYTTHAFNNGYYWFNQPIKLQETITLTFGHNFEYTPFLINRLVGTLVQGSNPMRINLDVPDYPYFKGHPNNTTAIISGFTTGDPSTDAVLIASVNTTQTLTLGDSYVTIPVDISGMTQTNDQILITLTYDDYGQMIHLTLIY